MAEPVDLRLPRRGIVTAFDADRGLGTVTVAPDAASNPATADRRPGGSGEPVAPGPPSGGAHLGALDFHCTAIADGSRQIAVGTAVELVVRPGHRGRLEAGWISPLA